MAIEELNIFQHLYDFIIWVLPKLEGFPKSYRFVLGQRMGDMLLVLLENLIDAATKEEKKGYLQRFDSELAKFRVLYRICKDLKIITIRQYAYGINRLEVIGNLLGGWIKKEVQKQ